jgi:D-alanine transaminase
VTAGAGQSPLCYLDGRLLPLDEARVHPLDRGFTYGDAIYDVVRVREEVPLRLAAHLERLRRNLEAVDIPAPAGLGEACGELARRNEVEAGSLFLQVTRGVAPRTPIPPRGLRPTVLIVATLHPLPGPATQPLRAVSAPDWRWQRCDLKTTSLMGAVLGKLRARDASADEVVWLGPDGGLREGGHTNLFVRHGETLETASLDAHVLPGVTRTLLLALAAELGLPLVERAPRPAERGEWHEALLCGTLTGVQPLVALDGEPIGDGAAGEWTRTLAVAHAAAEAREVAAAHAEAGERT